MSSPESPLSEFAHNPEPGGEGSGENAPDTAQAQENFPSPSIPLSRQIQAEIQERKLDSSTPPEVDEHIPPAIMTMINNTFSPEAGSKLLNFVLRLPLFKREQLFAAWQNPEPSQRAYSAQKFEQIIEKAIAKRRQGTEK